MCSWLSFILLVALLCFSSVSGARHRHSAAVLTGTVYCDTCFRQQVPKSTHLISGATVAVECGGNGLKPSFREEVTTNEKGDFEAKLPVYVSKNIEKVKGCSVRLITNNNPYCAVAATTTATSSDIRLKSKKAGTHIVSAGFFTLKPQLCNEKDSVKPLSDKPSDQKTFWFPFPPNPFQPPTLPPLPFQPSPPSLFPPLPFQPSPPSVIPPVFPSPPPASLFPPLPFPPVPGLIPSPPPPPPPAFPIPLPPLPLIPGIPPVPPASTSPSSGKATP